MMPQPGGMYTVVVGPFNKYPYTPNFFNVTGYRNGDLSVVPDGTVNGRPSTKPAIPKGTRFKYVCASRLEAFKQLFLFNYHM